MVPLLCLPGLLGVWDSEASKLECWWHSFGEVQLVASTWRCLFVTSMQPENQLSMLRMLALKCCPSAHFKRHTHGFGRSHGKHASFGLSRNTFFGQGSLHLPVVPHHLVGPNFLCLRSRLIFAKLQTPGPKPHACQIPSWNGMEACFVTVKARLSQARRAMPSFPRLFFGACCLDVRTLTFGQLMGFQFNH